jgi:hypothetical protein
MKGKKNLAENVICCPQSGTERKTDTRHSQLSKWVSNSEVSNLSKNTDALPEVLHCFLQSFQKNAEMAPRNVSYASG